MMNTMNPSPSEIDSAVNLLSVLELAKDATKLKEALNEIKVAHDAVAKERAAAQEATKLSEARMSELAEIESQVAFEKSKLKEGMSQLFKNNEDLEMARAAMREDRNAFDTWMASQREALAADRAKVDSDSAENKRKSEEAAAAMRAADARMQQADQIISSAEAKRQEYETKLANLKAMVG